MFAGYLGPDPTPESVDPSKRKYNLVHQCCACHIINLIVKSGLKRYKPYTEDFRTAINFLNSSNQRMHCSRNTIMLRVLDLESLAWIWMLDENLLT